MIVFMRDMLMMEIIVCNIEILKTELSKQLNDMMTNTFTLLTEMTGRSALDSAAAPGIAHGLRLISSSATAVAQTACMRRYAFATEADDNVEALIAVCQRRTAAGQLDLVTVVGDHEHIGHIHLVGVRIAGKGYVHLLDLDYTGVGGGSKDC